MPYQINNINFKLKELSLAEDEKLAAVLDKVFGAQLDAANKEHQKKLAAANSDVPFIQTQFIDDSVIITGGFLAKLLETKAAVIIADMILVPEARLTLADSILFKLKKYRLYWFSKHIKGDLKAKIFTDFFSEGTVYAASLVNHFLILLSSRIAQLNELKVKNSD